MTLSKFLAIAIGALAAILLLVGEAHAQGADPQVPANLFAHLMVALVTGRWLVVAGLVVATIVATAATHKAGITRIVPWFTTDAGATVWTFVVSIIGAIATSLSIGQPLSLATLQAGVAVGIGAVGGYSGARKLLGPSGVGRWVPWLDRLVDAFGPKNPGVMPALVSK